MAQITMDSSEWELMKSKEALLEKALSREQELNNSIKQLQEEKVKALEDAKMKVVKIIKTEVHEYLLQKRDAYDAWRELVRIVQTPMQYSGALPNLTAIEEAMFTRCKSMRLNTIESGTTTTLHGLDEVVESIRKEYKEAQDAKVTEKLEEYNILSREVYTIKSDLSSCTKERDILSKAVRELHEEKETLTLEVFELKKAVEHFKSKLKSILDSGHFWNIKSKIYELYTLLK